MSTPAGILRAARRRWLAHGEVRGQVAALLDVRVEDLDGRTPLLAADGTVVVLIGDALLVMRVPPPRTEWRGGGGA